MRQFIYPALLEPDAEAGGFVVTFPDVPEAITQGDDPSDALHQAADCLEEAIAGRIRRDEPIPEASRVRSSQQAIPLPARTAAKAALHLAFRQAHLTKREVAERLHCDEDVVTRLLDPRYPSNLDRLEAALAALGQQLVVGVQAAPDRALRRRLRGRPRRPRRGTSHPRYGRQEPASNFCRDEQGTHRISDQWYY